MCTLVNTEKLIVTNIFLVYVALKMDYLYHAEDVMCAYWPNKKTPDVAAVMRMPAATAPEEAPRSVSSDHFAYWGRSSEHSHDFLAIIVSRDWRQAAPGRYTEGAWFCSSASNLRRMLLPSNIQQTIEALAGDSAGAVGQTFSMIWSKIVPGRASANELHDEVR